MPNPQSLKEMDSGDVLAYSGEISGEFKSVESPTKPALPKETLLTKSTTPHPIALVEAKQERMPKKLTINVDPGIATGASNGKPLTVISTQNNPESASTTSQAKLK